MKKLFLLVLMLCCFCTTALAADAPYVNEKYGFSFVMPGEFKTANFDGPFSLGAYTNNKIFLQLRYITPQAKYSGPTFGTTTKAEIEDFIKRQRFVTAVNNNKFAFLQYDTHVTAKKFPYVWAMFVSGMDVGSEHFKTFFLKNYFYNKDIIIEVDFLIPEDVMKESVPTINKITDSFEFKNPATTTTAVAK
jgi:hypothetical protein